jgi:hypothetical protein
MTLMKKNCENEQQSFPNVPLYSQQNYYIPQNSSYNSNYNNFEDYNILNQVSNCYRPDENSSLMRTPNSNLNNYNVVPSSRYSKNPTDNVTLCSNQYIIPPTVLNNSNQNQSQLSSIYENSSNSNEYLSTINSSQYPYNNYIATQNSQWW